MLSTADLPAHLRPKKKKSPPLKPLPPIALFTDATRALSADAWTRIVLPYPPSTNRMYRNFRGVTVLSREGRRYKRYAGDVAAFLGRRPIVGRVHLLIDLYRPQKSGDLDNFFKVVIDSIKGLMFGDDAEIKGICANQHEDRDFPRVVVAVRLALGETLNFAEVGR